ncbi:MAG: NifU family protein [Gemmatimonadota bacterium]
MLTFTDTARRRVAHFLELQKDQQVSALRIAGDRSRQRLWLVKPEDREATDSVFRVDDFDVYLDPLSADKLQGATVDFVDGVMQSGFRVFFPSPRWDDPLAQRVQDVIDTVINPGVAAHSGNVTLTGVEDGVAIIAFGGGCQGCGAADVTLKGGVERILKQHVSEIVAVRDATDHAAGENPYYVATDGDIESPLS